MSFFSSIFKGKVNDRAAGSGYRFPFDPRGAVKVVNERTAMQTTAVYAAVRILTESIASLPLHVYKQNGDENHEKVEN